MDLVTEVTFIALVAADAVLEGGADDALGAAAGEDVGLDDGLVRRSGVETSAHRGVLALGVLAEDYHVDVARLLAGQGRGHSGVEVGGAHAYSLVEAATHGKQEAVQGDVVRDVGVSDGAEEDGVEAGELFQAILGHQAAGLAVVVAAPGELGKPEGRATGR